MFVVKYERLDTSFLSQLDISIFYTQPVEKETASAVSTNGKKQEDPEEEKNNGQVVRIADSDFVNITLSEPKTSTRTKSRGFGLFGSKNKDKDEKDG